MQYYINLTVNVSFNSNPLCYNINQSAKICRKAKPISQIIIQETNRKYKENLFNILIFSLCFLIKFFDSLVKTITLQNII